MRLVKLALLVLLAVIGLMYWAGRVVSDPSDMCNDSSLSGVAQYVSCSIERR